MTMNLHISGALNRLFVENDGYTSEIMHCHNKIWVIVENIHWIFQIPVPNFTTSWLKMTHDLWIPPTQLILSQFMGGYRGRVGPPHSFLITHTFSVSTSLPPTPNVSPYNSWPLDLQLSTSKPTMLGLSFPHPLLSHPFTPCSHHIAAQFSTPPLHSIYFAL